MAQAGRKGVGEQIAEKAKPDSQKTTTEKAGESITGAADKLMGSAQPNESKTTTQKASDSVRGSGNTGSSDKGYLESAKDALNSATGSKK